VYGQEPRWIDLRWVGATDILGAADSSFVERVADLAAPIHGKERGDIVGENVGQHRISSPTHSRPPCGC
jgi:hypothetical protein